MLNVDWFEPCKNMTPILVHPQLCSEYIHNILEAHCYVLNVNNFYELIFMPTYKQQTTNSRVRKRRKEHSPSWMSVWRGKTTPSPPESIRRKHTPIGTFTTPPNTTHASWPMSYSASREERRWFVKNGQQGMNSDAYRTPSRQTAIPTARCGGLLINPLSAALRESIIASRDVCHED